MIGDFLYVWQWPLERREGTVNPDQRWRLEGKGRSVKWTTISNPGVFSSCGCKPGEHLSGEFTTRKDEKLSVALLNETDWDTAWGLQQDRREAAQSIQNRENGSADKDCLLWKQSSYTGEGFYCCRVHSREGDMDGVIVSRFWKVSALWCLMAEFVPFWVGDCLEILKQWQQIIILCEFRKGSSPPCLETNSSHHSNSTAGHLCLHQSSAQGWCANMLLGALGSVVGWKSISVSCFPIREARE